MNSQKGIRSGLKHSPGSQRALATPMPSRLANHACM